MKKLLAILGVSVGILIGVIGYAAYMGVNVDDTVNLEDVESLINNEDSKDAPIVTPDLAPIENASAYVENIVETTEEEWSEEMEEEAEADKEDGDSESEVDASESGETDVVTHNKNSYYYNQLSENERKVYDVIFKAIVGYDEGATMPTMDEKLIDKIFNAVLADHPEIFYVNGYRCTKYSQGNVVKRIAFTGSYTYSKSAKTEIEPRLVEAKNDILKNVYPAASDYDKIKYIYETIIKNTEYNLNSPDNQNVISVLLNHSSVCQGYAKTFQWLLNDLGIPCTLDNGVVIGGERHAWNVCMADGEWYYVDPTWGDSSYTNPDGSNVSFMPEINYDYLLVPLSELSHTHTSEAVVAMPLATSIADNYYVREGLYLTGYDFNAVKAMADGQRALGRQALVVKCADDMVFKATVNDLVDNQKIFDLVNTKEIRYQLEEDRRKLVFALQ